jgi:hypothetical protein
MVCETSIGRAVEWNRQSDHVVSLEIRYESRGDAPESLFPPFSAIYSISVFLIINHVKSTNCRIEGTEMMHVHHGGVF